jgi:hypothetical protein
MPDIVYRPEFDDSNLQEALKQLEGTTNKVKEATDELGARATKSMKQVAAEVSTAERQVQQMTETAVENARAMDQAADSGEKFAGSTGQIRKGVSDIVDGIKVGNKSIGEWRTQLKQMTQSQSEAASSSGKLGKSTGGLSKVMGKLKAAIPLAVLAGLIKALKSSEKATKFFERATSALSAGWKTLVKNIENGDFKNLGKDILDAGKAAFEARRQLQNLDVVLRQLSIRQAELADINFEATQAIEDGNRSYQQRVFIARQVAQSEQQLALQFLQEAESRLDAMEAEQATSEELAAQQIRVAQLRVSLREANRRGELRIADLEADRLRRIEEEQKRLEKLRAEYERLTQSLEDQANASRLSMMTDINRLISEREAALQGVKELRQQIIDFSNENGLELPENLDQDVADIVSAIEMEFQKEIDKLRGEGNDPLSQLVTINDPAAMQARIGETVRQIGITTSRRAWQPGAEFFKPV